MAQDLTTFMQVYEQAIIDGVKQSGNGRGINIIEKRNGSWQIVHEHLSN